MASVVRGTGAPYERVWARRSVAPWSPLPLPTVLPSWTRTKATILDTARIVKEYLTSDTYYMLWLHSSKHYEELIRLVEATGAAAEYDHTTAMLRFSSPDNAGVTLAVMTLPPPRAISELSHVRVVYLD